MPLVGFQHILVALKVKIIVGVSLAHRKGYVFMLFMCASEWRMRIKYMWVESTIIEPKSTNN